MPKNGHAYDRYWTVGSAPLRAVAVLGFLAASAVFPAPALAGPVDLTFTTPMNDKDATAKVVIGGTSIEVTIPPGIDAAKKRGLIRDAIKANKVPKFTVDDTTGKTGDPGITIQALAKGTKVLFAGSSTGEKSDSVVAALTNHAAIGFQNSAFASVGAGGTPSTFTAGVVTDAGPISFTFAASDFTDLSGSTIAAKFLDSLAPEAGPFGFAITRSNDVLDVTFDPANTVTGGGVLFGTTALSPGVFGEVDAGEVPEPPSLALLAAAIAGLGVAMSRRSRRGRGSAG